MDDSRERDAVITVFLADDNLHRARGRARADRPPQRPARSSASAPTTTRPSPGATATAPNVLVTDIRMPPSFNREGIDAAKEVRKRHPGTGIVDPLPVRRPRVRRRAARRGLGRLRLPLEGPPRPGQPTHRGHPHGRDRRHRPRPVDRRGADAPGHLEQRTLATPKSPCSPSSPRASRSRRSRPPGD